MTAKHKTPSRVRRNSLMESFGFTETPSVSYTSTPTLPSRPTRTTRLVSTSNRPAHTVEEMWNTTELETFSMADWAPVEVERRLGKRFRWPLVAAWMLVVVVTAAGGAWFWQTRGEASTAAMDTVRTAAGELSATLGPLEDATATLGAGSGPAMEQILAQSGDTDDASRALFSAAAELPGAQASTRSIATEATTMTLDASRTLTQAAAFLGAVTPVLETPALITDPELVDLATATTDFGGWVAKFEMVLGGLPEDVMPDVEAAMSTLSSDLAGLQTAYLDALREDDGAAALQVVQDLEERLGSIRTTLDSQAVTVRDSIVGLIQLARESLISLTG